MKCKRSSTHAAQTVRKDHQTNTAAHRQDFGEQIHGNAFTNQLLNQSMRPNGVADALGFEALLQTSWGLEDIGHHMNGMGQNISNQYGLHGRVGGHALRQLGNAAHFGSDLASTGATAAGMWETLPGLGDWMDFGCQSAYMLKDAAQNSGYRKQLTGGGQITKNAVKQYLGNPSETKALTDLRPKTPGGRDQQVEALLGQHTKSIQTAADNNHLEPEMVGALALAEQRDQRGAENVMDWLMGIGLGNGETSVGMIQGTANSSRRYGMVDNAHRMSNRQLAIALHNPDTAFEAGARRLRKGADLGAQAEADGRNKAVDDIYHPNVRVDLTDLAKHSSHWSDPLRRISVDEYTSAPFDPAFLNGGHAKNGSPGGWGDFAIEGYHDIQKAGLLGQKGT